MSKLCLFISVFFSFDWIMRQCSIESREIICRSTRCSTTVMVFTEVRSLKYRQLSSKTPTKISDLYALL